MSDIELYVHPTCTSCRNAQTWLGEHQIAYRRRDFFRDRFSKDELAEVLTSAGLTPRDVLSKRARAYKELVGDRELTGDQLLDLMIQEPTLLRRPLLISDGKAVIGFDRQGLERIATSVTYSEIHNSSDTPESHLVVALDVAVLRSAAGR